MSTPVDVPYPPCANRLDGILDGCTVTHARCDDPARACYGCFIRPIHCQQCLAGAEIIRPKETATAPATIVPESKPEPEDPPPPQTPGLLRRAWSYTEALVEWTAAGKPERSDKEVERIFHHFCKPCKWFDRDHRICRGCGCRVAASGYAILNKIKMATEHCPRDLW